ncbi:MAG: hypothetical protein NPIRA02_02280 [Nitrospirales bacterium]|nr:MAG: hypothetical protein NPIRA02_02280 [Nitrospirales bacterium]
MSTSSHSLSWNEKRAAEAAFLNRPFDPAWGEAAQRVYVGIQSTKGNGPVIEDSLPQHPMQPTSSFPEVDSSHALWSVMFQEPQEHRYMIFPIRLSVADVLSTIKCLVPQRRFELLRVIPLKGRRQNDSSHTR